MGTQRLARVRENPYRLSLDIQGIGFKTADELAQRLVIPRDSLLRARAGVRHVLQTISDEGHCAYGYEDLIEVSVKLLEITRLTLVRAIELEIEAEHLVAEVIDGKTRVYLAALLRAEQGVTSHLARLTTGPPSWGPIDVVGRYRSGRKHGPSKCVFDGLRMKVLIPDSIKTFG